MSDYNDYYVVQKRINDLISKGEGRFNGDFGPYHVGGNLPTFEREILWLLRDIADLLPKQK